LDELVLEIVARHRDDILVFRCNTLLHSDKLV
jgi:hypothetical protein